MFQTTSTGATYLQVFIVFCLLIAVVYFLVRQIVQIIRYVQENLSTADIDQRELFKQINHHTPIDGYRIFTERQSGSRYTVTLLSRNNRRCVLAEIEDVADPQGVIKIIAF